MGDSRSVTQGTILVVDDNQDICSFMRAVLEGAGYEVQTAAEGAAALALLRARRTDLLLTDIFMPGQEGIETVWRCKAQFPQTRIIAMSAGGDASIKLNFLPAAALIGADATLRKPFDADQLLHTVRGVLLARP